MRSSKQGCHLLATVSSLGVAYELRKKASVIYGDPDEQAPRILTVSPHMAISPLAPPVEPPAELEASCEVPAPPAAVVVD